MSAHTHFRLLWPALWAVVAVLPSAAQISPGPLARPHAFLNGPTHCIECHDVARRPPEFKCLGCHKDIQHRLYEKHGLHPSLVGNGEPSETCARCHSDHAGKDYSMIHWDTPLKGFDHRRAAYTLEGKHARLNCRDCHQLTHIPESAREFIVVKDLSRTYLGLSRQCCDCHADEHRGQLKPGCDRCHNVSGWKDTSQFDHGRTQYPLEGAHQKVACIKCHPKIGDSKGYAKYKELAFVDCTPCHADPHRGAFRAECKSCHGTANWKPVATDSSFSHFRTKYPLLGKHAAVPCQSCHATVNYKAPVAFAQCVDCHKKDTHRGQFKLRAGHGDCAECHKVEGFKPAFFTVEQHRASDYPLEGRHAPVPCAKCHIPKGPDTIWRIADTQCRSCHMDVHRGQFSSTSHKDCDSCHTVKGFKPSTYTIARHNGTRFVLAGAHAAVVCGDCHQLGPEANAAYQVQYRYEDRACTACHRDPHQGEFADRMKAGSGPDAQPQGCESCHSTRSWQDLHGFDHSNSKLPLEGAHRAVPCRDCHKPAGLDMQKVNVQFNAAPQRCSGCHDDIHGGQFAEKWKSDDCARCHSAGRWKPSTFDHGAESSYPLVGAHKNVPCALCHKVLKERAGRMVLVYAGTPRTCSACHANTIPSLNLPPRGTRTDSVPEKSAPGTDIHELKTQAKR